MRKMTRRGRLIKQCRISWKRTLTLTSSGNLKKSNIRSLKSFSISAGSLTMEISTSFSRTALSSSLISSITSPRAAKSVSRVNSHPYTSRSWAFKNKTISHALPRIEILNPHRPAAICNSTTCAHSRSASPGRKAPNPQLKSSIHLTSIWPSFPVGVRPLNYDHSSSIPPRPKPSNMSPQRINKNLTIATQVLTHLLYLHSPKWSKTSNKTAKTTPISKPWSKKQRKKITKASAKKS